MRKHLSPASLFTYWTLPLAAATATALLASPVQAQFQWAERIASTGSLPPNHGPLFGLALDTTDNSYVAGWFDGTNDFGGVILTNQSAGGADLFVARYNGSGTLQWARRAGGTGFNNGRGIGVDTNGNVYVTGGVFGPASFATFNLPASAYQEFFLAKYNGSGAVQWVEHSVAGYDVLGKCLAVDSAGNSYALLDLGGVTPLTLGPTNLSLPNGYGDSDVLVKYDTSGALQWAVLLGNSSGSGQVVGSGVAVDAAGNVYAYGSFISGLTIGANTLTASGKGLFTAKFGSSGSLVWAVATAGGSPNPGGVAVDAESAYISGAYSAASTISFGGVSLTNGGAFIVKYDNSGTAQWATQAGGPGGGGPSDVGVYANVALDARTNIYVAGILSNNAAVARYSPAGALEWTYSVSTSPTNSTGSLAECTVDAAGHPYLSGLYQGTATLGTNALQPVEPWNFFLAEVASYTFGPEFPSTNTANLTRDPVSGTFQYTDAANPTEDHAYLPLTGAAAALINSSNGWTASLTVNLTARTLTNAGDTSAHVVMGLLIADSTNYGNLVFIWPAQENNTGGGDDSIYPHGWYGTAVRFGANKNGVADLTTPLDGSAPSPDGSVYLPLSGGTNGSPASESIPGVTGVVTLTYDSAAQTITGYYNGVPVGQYPLAGWGPTPPLSLAVWGGSGKGVEVPAGTATAGSFYASSLDPTPPGGDCVGTDDFASGLSPSNWTIQPTNQGQMTIRGTNGHASFIVTNSTTTDEQNAFIAWRCTPTAGADWTVDITGHNSAPWSAAGSSQLQLAVLDTASLNSTVIGYQISMRRDNPSTFSTAQWQESQTIHRASVATSTVDFGLRLVYRSAIRQLEAWYASTASGSGWTRLDAISLTQFSSAMTASNTFTFAILADTYYGPISEGDLWAGNFRITNSATAPPTISLPARSPNAQFQMLVDGAAGQNYTVQMSTNIASANWTSLFVTNAPGGAFLFTDPNATNRQRFYRVWIGP